MYDIPDRGNCQAKSKMSTIQKKSEFKLVLVNLVTLISLNMLNTFFKFMNRESFDKFRRCLMQLLFFFFLYIAFPNMFLKHNIYLILKCRLKRRNYMTICIKSISKSIAGLILHYSLFSWWSKRLTYYFKRTPGPPYICSTDCKSKCNPLVFK